ncbi:MAG TPA: IS3 family transposase [Bacillus sp. (in: firmicutes)]|nr:IS3 family transposase [Bacillus sp. (in: firmicutes)]
MYYYHNKPVMIDEEPVKRGRPFPGFSKTNDGTRISDEQIEEWLMEAVEGEEGIYGYKKLTQYLKETYFLQINKKKVHRLCDKLGILLPVRHAPSPYPKKLAKKHVITAPNQLWQVDIKYGSIEESGRFFFLASAIDVFDRNIVGYYRGSKCQAIDITAMLQEAIRNREVSIPTEEERHSLIIRSDNGPQFLSKEFGDFCLEHKVYHERIPPKSPNLNAYIESFHSIIERECYQRHSFECFEEAYYWIDHYMDFYNYRRYHGSLKYLSPTKYNWKFRKEGFVPEMAVNL